MADSSSSASGDVNQLATKLQTNLESWRELVVAAREILVWSQPHHGYLVAGAVTTIFFVIWVVNASILTTLSIIGILVTVADYAVPLLCTNFFDAKNWNEDKEKTFKETCVALAATWEAINRFWTYLSDLKTAKPMMYSSMLLCFLLKMAWIGNIFNNLLLTYLTVLFVASYPGLRAHGIIEQYLGDMIAKVKSFVGEKLDKLKQQ
ncbi:ADP-ribosylation factor-like protein 6-interacting protein 1 [Halotydeus destructor]|nr:ADP-ribosylation factor-like protein 6-interacting protein 1 [Halotydeus destructor]